MARRLPLLSLLGGVALAGLTVACENHTCDPSASSWGMTGGQGDVAPWDPSKTTWESSPEDGTWAPFPHMVSETFDYGSLFPSCPSIHIEDPQISPDPVPSQPGSNFAWAAGNLAEVVGAAPGSITVFNDSCADYYIRVVVHCSLEGAGGAPDGG